MEEYNELCQKIWVLRNQFYREYHIKPNIVNIGYDDINILKTGNQFIIENTMISDKENFTIFGMKLKRVTEDHYLAVGFVLEDNPHS